MHSPNIMGISMNSSLFARSEINLHTESDVMRVVQSISIDRNEFTVQFDGRGRVPIRVWCVLCETCATHGSRVAPCRSPSHASNLKRDRDRELEKTGKATSQHQAASDRTV